MDGVLVIDKPSGPTSHDVVARVRRVLRTKRIGHTGTLDPLATGVLPLVIGRATRLASLLSAAEKSYEADVRLGCATDSYDASERMAAGIPPPPPPDVAAADVEALLDRFRGSYLQAPPAYSAKKIGGVAAHRLARRNQAVQPAPSRVTVSDLAMLSLADGLLRVRVTATAGFYVRTLAHELGAALGCGGHLEGLRRTRVGAFSLAGAVALDALESEGDAGAARLIPIEALLLDVPAVMLNERGVRRASHGNAVGFEDFSEPAGLAWVDAVGSIRLVDEGGRLLGIAKPAPGGLLHPSIVLV